MKDKLDKAIELLKEAECPTDYEGHDTDSCSWCNERDKLLAEVESSEDKEEDSKIAWQKGYKKGYDRGYEDGSGETYMMYGH